MINIYILVDNEMNESKKEMKLWKFKIKLMNTSIIIKLCHDKKKYNDNDDDKGKTFK